MATCLPSVAFFDTGDGTSVARVLGGRPVAPRRIAPCDHLRRGEPQPRGRDAPGGRGRSIAPRPRSRAVQFLNTVIGKMSGVITDAATIAS